MAKSEKYTASFIHGAGRAKVIKKLPGAYSALTTYKTWSENYVFTPMPSNSTVHLQSRIVSELTL
jgi:hypothetical protein